MTGQSSVTVALLTCIGAIDYPTRGGVPRFDATGTESLPPQIFQFFFG
jgi:hypothetical protein